MTKTSQPDYGRTAAWSPGRPQFRIHFLAEGRIEGDDPLAPFSSNAARHLLRSDDFEHVADVMVGSVYDAELDEGCAFEELISFRGAPKELAAT